MRTTSKRKNMLSVLAAAVMLMTALLTACGSGQEAATSTQAEASKVETETAKAEETAPAAPTETKEAESTEEPTEPTPEPVVYEGIDMESTLPGVEWIKTFDGVIEEPKMVIFNDATNKKMILENGQEVEFSDTDTFAIWGPSNKKIIGSALNQQPKMFRDNSSVEQAILYYDIRKDIKDGDKVNLSQELEVDGEKLVLNVTLVVKKSE